VEGSSQFHDATDFLQAENPGSHWTVGWTETRGGVDVPQSDIEHMISSD